MAWEAVEGLGSRTPWLGELEWSGSGVRGPHGQAITARPSGQRVRGRLDAVAHPDDAWHVRGWPLIGQNHTSTERPADVDGTYGYCHVGGAAQVVTVGELDLRWGR